MLYEYISVMFEKNDDVMKKGVDRVREGAYKPPSPTGRGESGAAVGERRGKRSGSRRAEERFRNFSVAKLDRFAILEVRACIWAGLNLISRVISALDL